MIELVDLPADPYLLDRAEGLRVLEWVAEHPGSWGVEVLVDVRAYKSTGHPGGEWCRLERVLERWTAGVYRVKALILDRGVGQWKPIEIRGVRLRSPVHPDFPFPEAP